MKAQREVWEYRFKDEGIWHDMESLARDSRMLDSADGSPRKKNVCTCKRAPDRCSRGWIHPKLSACISDEMAMVQRLKGNHKTFANMSDALLSMILPEGAASKRIDVVLDVYRDTLIKKSREIQERGLNVNWIQKYAAGTQDSKLEKVLIKASK